MAIDSKTLDYLSHHADALKKAGAEAGTVTLNRTEGLDIALRNGRVITLESDPGKSSLMFESYADGRSGHYSPDTTRPDYLRDAARIAVESAKLTSENIDTAPALPEQMSPVRDDASLDILDPATPDRDRMIAMLQEMEHTAFRHPDITLSKGASASWARTHTYIMTTQGDLFTSSRSHFSTSISLVAERGKHKVTDSAYSAAHHFSDLRDAAAIGDEAAEQTRKALGAKRPPKTGKLPVVFSPDMASHLLRVFASAISGQTIMTKRSMFDKGTLGQRVFAPGIHIVNDPHAPRRLGSENFTDELLATRRQTMVDDGILQALFIDLESARRLGYAVTDIAGDVSNLTVANGAETPESLIGDIKDGLYVTQTMGHGVNINNGDYSVGIAGFWVRNGKIAQPVAEATIAGNLRDIFGNAIVANDLDTRRGAVRAPTLLVPSGLTVS